MSLARAALRIATVEALRPWAAAIAGGPYPTLAGRFVFDSRIDPVDDLAIAEQRPVICVYTEEDSTEKFALSGPQFYDQVVDLVIEMSVPASYPQAEAEPVVAPAVTDPALEFKLDMLELQVRHILHFGASPQAVAWQRMATLPAVAIHSVPHRTSEEGIRLAYRTLRLRIKLRSADVVPSGQLNAPTGFAAFPSPIAAFLASLPAGHYAVAIANALAPAVPVMPVANPLTTVTLGAQVGPPAPPGTAPVVPYPPNIAAAVQNMATNPGPVPELAGNPALYPDPEHPNG